MPIRCSACGRDNRDGSRYCLECGSALVEAAHDDSLVGRLIQERYRVVQVIGEGGMGRVYLAEQQMGTATRRVAVKVLHAIHSREETLRKRFYRECEVVIELTHPNTIHFHDFGELPDGRLYIVMELVDGPSLAHALAQGPMDWQRVARMVPQMCGSLHEAHEQGIVHRDLKPENVLLAKRGGEADFVKVCDFGIAKQTGGSADESTLTLQGTVIGTPQYMSPEQLTGGEVDRRADIYSLGLIVFEMLTGERPFSASSPLEWAARHTTADPPDLTSFEPTRDLPAHQRAAILRALAKLPRDRPATAKRFAAEFLGEREQVQPAHSHAPAAYSHPRPGVDVTGPTLHASPKAMRALQPSAPIDEGPPLRPAGVPSRARTWFSALLALAVLGAAGYGTWTYRDRIFGVDTHAAPDAGPPMLDAGSDAGPSPSGPTEWIRIVHFQNAVTGAANVLGPPDGRHAILHPGATLTVELAAGRVIDTDGGEGPDVYVEVDEERSGAYRLDVGVAVNSYTTVGSELVGSLPLDADQFEIDRIRYVRIKNRARQTLYIDAIGVYRAH